MSMRKITSLTATLSFILMVVTSAILFIVPQGTGRLLGGTGACGALTKEQWGAVHINIGVLFLLALLLHIYYNWKPLVAYLKDRSRRMKIFTPAFNLALVICVTTVAGTLFVVPPFSWVLDLNTTFKDAGAKKITVNRPMDTPNSQRSPLLPRKWISMRKRPASACRTPASS